MGGTVVVKVGRFIKSAIMRDYMAITDGRVALAISTFTMLLALENRSRIPQKFSKEYPWFWLSQDSYGFQMFFIVVLAVMIMVAFINMKDVEGYHRPMLFLALIFSSISFFVTYSWGLQHNLSLIMW